jgi:hypothetical protein
MFGTTKRQEISDETTAKPDYRYPVIAGHGGIVSLPEAAE